MMKKHKSLAKVSMSSWRMDIHKPQKAMRSLFFQAPVILQRLMSPSEFMDPFGAWDTWPTEKTNS